MNARIAVFTLVVCCAISCSGGKSAASLNPSVDVPALPHAAFYKKEVKSESYYYYFNINVPFTEMAARLKGMAGNGATWKVTRDRPGLISLSRPHNGPGGREIIVFCMEGKLSDDILIVKGTERIWSNGFVVERR